MPLNPLDVGDPAQPLAAAAGPKTIGEIYTIMGWTRYHTTLFLICGLGWVADAIETGLLSFLKKEVSETWPDTTTFWLTSLQYMVFIGEFLGCFIWGPMADKYGRKVAFLAANVGLCGFGLLSAAAPQFWILVALRFLVGMCIGGIIIPFDMLIECCEESKAAQVSFGVQYFWTGGTIYINLMAAIVLPLDLGGFEPWRVLTICAALPIVLAAMGYFLMEESPLWLQDAGRNDEALEVLNRIAATGKNPNGLQGITLVPYHREEEPSFSEVVKFPYRRRTMVFASMWMLGLFGYYGASLVDPVIFPAKYDANGVEETDYVSILFSACGEVLGVLSFSLFSLKLHPLKVTVIFFTVSCIGIGLILLKYVGRTGSDYEDVTSTYIGIPLWMLTLIVFIVRAAVMGASAGYYLVTPQSYPTHIRCTAHSFVNLFGRAGGFFATIAGSLGSDTGISKGGKGPPTQLMIQLLLYSLANAFAAVITFIEGPKLQYDDEALEVLGEDLGASHISKQKTRSFLIQNPASKSDNLGASEMSNRVA